MKKTLDLRLLEGFITNERLTLLFGRVLVVGLMVCLAVGVKSIAEQVFNTWNGWYLPWLVGLVTLEAAYTSGQVRRAGELEISVPVYRAVELVVILVLLKVFFYTQQGWGRLWSDLAAIGPGLFAQVFDTAYIVTAAMLLGLWVLASWIINDLYEIEAAVALLDAEGYEEYFTNCAAIRKDLASRLFGVGLVLVAISGLVRADMLSIGNAPSEFHAWYALAYFTILVLLLGQTYFSTLRAGWAWERIPIDKRIAGQWLSSGLLMLLLLGIVVSMLPTRYSLGFLETLGYVLRVVISAVVASVFLLIMALNFVLAWIISLFMKQQELPTLPAVEKIPAYQLTANLPPGASSTQMLQSLVFWGFLLLVVCFAFYQYLRQNQVLWKKLQQFGFWQGLGKLWGWMRAWMKIVSVQAGEAVQAGLQRLRIARGVARSSQPFRFLNLNRLSPRQRVLFFYLALVQRGEEAGIPRRPGQTPLEYEQTLCEHFLQAEKPPDQASLDALTKSFLEARYSQHPISVTQASQVKTAWDRLRQVLRGKK